MAFLFCIGINSLFAFQQQQADSPRVNLPFPLRDDFQAGGEYSSPFNLNNPSNFGTQVKYDPKTGRYTVYKMIGGKYVRYPRTFTVEEYLSYDLEQSIKQYWQSKQQADALGSEGGARAEKPLFGFEVESESFDRIFGGNRIDIRPQGQLEVDFGVNVSRTENPALAERQRRIITPEFNQRINLNVVGQIGEKLKLGTNYNTEATFEFDNQMKLDYSGEEDDIIKKIEAGNVSLPLNNSLITGSQSLFGIKTQLQFGRLTATTVFSQQKGKRSEIEVSGGAQTSKFEIKADEYEANKHFFLSNYFRNQYDKALASLPNVNSGINITRIEVWVTNYNNTTEDTRNIVAISDLGEDQAYQTPNYNPPFTFTDNDPGRHPYNNHNSIYADISQDPDITGFSNAASALEAKGYVSAVHFEKLESARKLRDSDFSLNPRLGFITLNSQPLNNDEVLAVAFEYTLNGETYQVGQLSTDGVNPPKALLLKLIKPTIINPRIPLWDLMMKNVYSINAYQVNKQDFTLNVLYNSPEIGVNINYLPLKGVEDKPLLQVVGLDRLDAVGASNPDGVFDFVDGAATNGGTINARNGRIYLTSVEPFGEFLEKQLIAAGVPPDTIANVVFKELYDSTVIAAQQIPEKNRFSMAGEYKSASGSEISLNALNIPEGSVVVSAGGVVLKENVDYTVDYNLGRVTIINQGLLESQTPIKISLESNSLFSVQQKTLIGGRFDYRVSKDINIGATILNLSERPITPKVNFGDEPINNTIYGFDVAFQKEAPFLTKLVDGLPFISTKEKSNISFNGEFAQLIPGHSRAIGQGGNAYIDDFEGSQSTIDLRSANGWSLASAPQGQPTLFPNGGKTNNLEYGYDRAQLAWHVIDPLFFRNDNLTPDNIDDDIRSNHFQRQVLEQEVFPNRQLAPQTPANIAVFDLNFFPKERGPYNFNPNLEPDGSLSNPEESWGGIMKRISTSNFEQNNVEFIQFWLMDPFNEDSKNTTGGDLYFNLGNISEDILKDSRKSFENGLPKNPSDIDAQLDTTVWGLIPKKQSIVNAFDNSDNSTKTQDVGMDGLPDLAERTFFKPFLDAIRPRVSPEAYNAIVNDPANDNYHYYRGTDYDDASLDIIERYKRYNGVEGNSPTTQDSPENYPTSATAIPTTEDVNLDNNLSESESYFQYRVSLRPEDMVVGQNFITNVVEAVPELPNGAEKPVKWYQFKVPVRAPEATIGGIQDLRAIRFIRMFMKGWSEQANLRFARLELVRGEWRKYQKALLDPDAPLPAVTSSFDIAAVNIEENSQREPVNYVLPPGIARERDVSTTNARELNEQALVLRSQNLNDGEAKAGFKNTQFDVRQYKKIQMYVHGENISESLPLNYGDITVFVRLGSDFENNYYEYEMPLTPTDISGGIVTDPNRVWPEANNMVIEFEDLQNLKIERNNGGNPAIIEYSKTIGKNRVTIKGNPVLSDVTTLMIGIRNPYREKNIWNNDDGRLRSVEVWVNELRLTDFTNEGGWAAVGRLNADLADFGTVAVAGNISTPGFGSIEKKVNERQQETRKGYDASTNLELGKFLPEESGIKIPMYMGVSEQTVNPRYDPLSPDLEFDQATDGLSKDAKEKRLRRTQTKTIRRSINFTGVRKERTNPEKKPKIYDVENLSLSYAYNETYFRDFNTENKINKTYRGGLTYGFNHIPKSIKPFEKVEWLQEGKYFAPIRDFNFYLSPRNIAFSTTVNRSYTQQVIRSNTEFELPPTPNYTKTFNWNRVYDLKYDLTKSLKLTYNANNEAVIGEPAGRVSKQFEDEYKVFVDSVRASIREFGETTHFTQTVGLNYNIPLSKIPALDWLDANLGYNGTYDWQRAPFSQDSLGHTLQNSNTKSINGQATFARLYNKVKFLRELTAKKNRARRSRSRSSAVSSLNNLNKIQPNKSDTTDKKKKKDPNALNPAEQFLSLLMSAKTATFTYTKNQGMMLPGYAKRTSIMGMDPGFNAPGFGFVFGQQNEDFPFMAAQEGWLVAEPELFQPYTTTENETYNLRLNLEPVKDMRIDLSWNKDLTVSSNGFFRHNGDTNQFGQLLFNPDAWELQSPVEQGSVSMSINMLKTAFTPDDPDNFTNPLFDELLENRREISRRLGEEDDNSSGVLQSGYYDGYSGSSQHVLIPSFMAAYTGKSANSVSLDIFGQTPAPSWNLTYTGLGKVPAMRKLFRNVSVNHAYKASARASYTTNLQSTDNNGNAARSGDNNDFIPERQITTVAIQESLAPLVGFNVSWKNSLSTKLNVNKDRQVALSLTNQQITEVKSLGFDIGIGYRFKDVKFPFQIGNKDLKSDINANAQISIARNVTVIRKINEGVNDPTDGRLSISIRCNADYVVNSQITIRAYYDRSVTKPVLSIPFPTFNTRAGLSFRYSLAP
ncbi:T9SS outer membrane translocon Sov/SprA [Luteibaculum oceani]|uniref:T9SS outer membrane translocon Sov/SprA n=1 Tax=Luteibaculum oceani TaxID=1294296 RepID=UPI001476B2F0|nr:cell surface protein SprA [Luteibaculum oceani]